MAFIHQASNPPMSDNYQCFCQQAQSAGPYLNLVWRIKLIANHIQVNCRYLCDFLGGAGNHSILKHTIRFCPLMHASLKEPLAPGHAQIIRLEQTIYRMCIHFGYVLKTGIDQPCLS